MKNIFLLFTILLCSSCEWESTPSTSNVGFAKTITEDQVIHNTMNDFVSDPKTQAEIDKNLILNHIIDHKLDMQSTSDGIYYQITKDGAGIHPTLKDVIVTNYHGTFLSGKVFDSKMDSKKPFTYPLNRMNDGWKKAIPLMKSGGKAIFIIPSSLCYGEQGFGELIPPHAVLKFEVELLGIKGD